MKYLLFLLNIFLLIKCKYEYTYSLNVYLNQKKYNIGRDGNFAMESNSHISGVFDRKDIENETMFNIELIADSTNNNYTLNCRLWLGVEDIIDIFCKFPEGLKTDETIYSAQIKAISHYKDNEININININNLKLHQLNYTLPFLYNEPIDININNNDKTDKIGLELRMDSYNEENLFMRDRIQINSFR